uniref:hypothetical protein n=1 Tax=Pseudomonas sp. RW407 TaxID=2202894 RepID=UPI001C453A16|nr:hypothetical protein [Pseudomonas sp. RW407]
MVDDVVDTTESTTSDPSPFAGMVRNLGEPIRFTGVQNLSGVSIEAAQEGATVKIATAMALTSDEVFFHQVVEQFVRVINHMAQQASMAVSLDRAGVVLLILRSDSTAELWLDSAAMAAQFIAKRSIKAGTVVFEHDIADITGMSFPCVDIGPADKVLCIFREGWRFGMAFDFNHKGTLNVTAFERTLGTLLRNLRYRHLYDALGNSALFSRLVAAGWFPFVEIISHEIKDLLQHLEAGFDVVGPEQDILNSFGEERMQGILERWAVKPHFAAKMALLKVAIDAFNRKEPITVIKVLLTEIEGVLNDAYRAANGGQGAKLKELLKFAMDSAERKVGGSDTLMFPTEFAEYLARHTFANFDPTAQTGTASSRHAVGHGAAPQESYTMIRALQVILTLDQLAFYT